MSTIDEITRLEEELRLAELGPDPAFFERVLADNVVVNNKLGKVRLMNAHRIGDHPKFTSVEIHDLAIRDHGAAAVVTCKGTFVGPNWSGTLEFMRVWLKTDGRWQVIAASVSS